MSPSIFRRTLGKATVRQGEPCCTISVYSLRLTPPSFPRSAWERERFPSGSQTPFGNRLRETLFRVCLPRSGGRRETEFRGQRSQTEFGNEKSVPDTRTPAERGNESETPFGNRFSRNSVSRLPSGVQEGGAKQSFADGVPKRSLGTSNWICVPTQSVGTRAFFRFLLRKTVLACYNVACPRRRLQMGENT